MITVNTPILGTGGTVAEVLAYAYPSGDAPPAVRMYLGELKRLCDLLGLDFRILATQSYHECFNPESGKAWDSFWWRTRRNPAGIGITGDDAENAASQTWLTGTEAARAHVAHMLAYVGGDLAIASLAAIGIDALAVNRRVAHVLDKPWAGSIRTLGDLTGKWAVDPRYADKIAAIANQMFKENASMSELVYGQVQHPPFVDRLIPDAENRAWNDLGPRRAVGVCQHSMIGTLWGTDRWFRRGAASTGLTDYGIGNSTDGAQWDGVILRWNDPTGKASHVDYRDADGSRHAGNVSPNRAGWANGGSDGLEGDGPLFVRTLGVDAINRDLVSIERSDGGDINTPMSPKQFDSICRLTAHWFDRARVPWDRFPLNPAAGVVTHMLHFEFATKACPFPPVRSRIDEIQARVRAILKAAQTQTEGTPAEKPPVPIERDHDKLPNGWTLEQLTSRFRRPVYEQIDGTRERVGFNLKGSISNAWLARAVNEGITEIRDLPVPQRMIDIAQPDSGLVSTVVAFDGRGSDNWMLIRPDKSVAWRWVL